MIPTLRTPCRSHGRTKLSGCSQLMTWTFDGHWSGKCSCGFGTRAASGDAIELDRIAGRT